MRRAHQRWATGAAAACAALLAFFLTLTREISRVSLDPPLNPDTVAHLLAARGCAEGEGCLLRVLPLDGTEGSTTPIGIEHGALINHAMAVTRSLTGESMALGWALAIMTALVAAVMLLAARRIWGLWAGLACAAICAVWLGATVGGPLSHPSFTPLPSAIYVAAGCAFLATGRLRYLGAAGFAVGVAAQLHLAAFVHVAGLAALVSMAPKGRRRGAGFTAALAMLAPLLASPAMFFVIRPSPGGLSDRPDLLSAGALMAAGGGLLAFSLLYRRDEPPARLVRFLVFTHVPFAAALFLLGPSSKYLLPLLPGLTLLAVGGGFNLVTAVAGCARALPESTRASFRFAAIVVLATASLSTLFREASLPLNLAPAAAGRSPGELRSFLSDARDVAEHLEGRGWTYEELFRALRGDEGYWYLLQAAGYFMKSEAAGAESRRSRPSLLVLATEGTQGELPEGWALLGREGEPGLLVKEYEPYLDWESFHLRASRPRREGHTRWIGARYTYAPEVHPSQEHLVYNRGAPRISPFRDQGGPDELVVAVPFRLPAGAEPRLVTLGRESHPQACAGAVVAVLGVPHEGNLPARSIWLSPGEASDAPAEGLIVFSWDPGSCRVGFAHDMPPAVMELSAADLEVAAHLLEEGREPRGFSAGEALLALDPLELPPAGAPPEEGPAAMVSRKEPLAPFWYAAASLGFALAGLLAGLLLCVAWSLRRPFIEPRRRLLSSASPSPSPPPRAGGRGP